MTKEEKRKRINEILNRLKEINPDWSFLNIKIRTNTYTDGETAQEVHEKMRVLDNEKHALMNEIRGLQTVYQVDSFNGSRISVTSQVIMNEDVDIDTYTNKWEFYKNNAEARQLICDIYSVIGEHELINIKKI